MKNRRMIRSHYLWMRSYVFVTVIMIAILVALITWMSDEFTKEIERMNHGLTSVLQTSIDTRLNDIEHFTAQLQMNPVNLKMSRVQKGDEIDKASLIRFSRRLYDYKLSNAFIKEIYIYYPHLGLVAGDLGCFSAEQYYLLKNNLSRSGYGEWLDGIKSSNKTNWYFAGREDAKTELCLTKRLPYGLTGDNSAILMVTVDRQAVEAILRNAREGMGSALAAVVSEDDTVYVSAGAGIDLNVLKESLHAGSGTPFFKFAGNYGSVMESDDYKIKYVTLIERHQLLDSGYFIRNIAYAAIGLCMVFGAVLFALLGFRGARPLKEILERLGDKSQPAGRMVNDYDLIGSELNQMYLKAAESSRKLKRQQENLEGLFLCSLLNSEERSDSVIFASIQRFGIQMEYSMFETAVLRCLRGFEAEPEKASAAIQEALKKKEDMSVILTEFDGDLVLLFHMEPEYGYGEMRIIAGEIQQAMGAAFSGAEFLFLFGGIYDSMSHIIVSYQEALLAAEFCRKERVSIGFFEEGTATDRKEEHSYYGIMAEYEGAMLEGRYEEADRLLDLLFNQYIGADLNVYSSRAKKYAVVNTVLEALRACEGNGGVFGKALIEPLIGQLSAAKDISELVRLLHEGLASLILWQQKRQSDQKENLAERAKQYIDSNFKDPMIGLYSISDTLGVSNTYLSTTFKKMYGIGLAQYINTMRIACAKRLILHSGESIKEIALSVGFSSDAVFIRVFKQFENTTPGRYKKK